MEDPAREPSALEVAGPSHRPAQSVAGSLGPEGLDRGAGPALTLLLQAYRPQNIDLLYRGRASVSWLGARVLAEQREASAGVRVHVAPVRFYSP